MTDAYRIHHINFIVRDVDRAVKAYEDHLGIDNFVFEDLSKRGVRTARVALGSSWLVLVAPTRRDSAPARFLEENGEGFLLLSLGVSDLESALEAYDNRHGVCKRTEMRKGLMDWRVADLDTKQDLGVMFHFTEEQ